MVWVKTDDDTPNHPKALSAGIAALGLWYCGLSYANKHATDGYLPKDLTLVFLKEKRSYLMRLAERLVEVGLWDRVDPSSGALADVHGIPGGAPAYLIRSYSERQPMATRAAQIQKKTEDKRRQQRFREKMAQTDPLSQRDKSVVTALSQHPDQTRPDQTRPKEENNTSSSPNGEARSSALAGVVTRVFRDAYETKRNVPWMQHAKFFSDFEVIAKCCKSEADAKIGIENFFRNADAYAVKQDYSPAILAKNWNMYRHPPKPSVVSANPLADDSRWHESNRAAWVYDRFDQPPPGCDSARLWWEHHENNRIREAS